MAPPEVEDELSEVAALIRGVELEVAARCEARDALDKTQKTRLQSQVKAQRLAVQGLRKGLRAAMGRAAASADSRQTLAAARRDIAAIETALTAANEELARLLKALHFPGFAADHVIGEAGGAFVGVRDVWLERVHASASIRVSPSAQPTLSFELGAPGGDSDEGVSGTVARTRELWSRSPQLGSREIALGPLVSVRPCSRPTWASCACGATRRPYRLSAYARGRPSTFGSR